MHPSNAECTSASPSVVAVLESALLDLAARVSRLERERAHVEFENVVGIELLRERRVAHRAGLTTPQ